MTTKERWTFLGTLVMSIAFLAVWVFLVLTGHQEANNLFPIITLVAGHFYGKYSGDMPRLGGKSQ